MGYHARFYAPALPLFFSAAVRGWGVLGARRQMLVVAGLIAIPGLISLYAYQKTWIEIDGYGLGCVRTFQYFIFFVGLPAVIALRALAQPMRSRVMLAGGVLVAIFQVWALAPKEFRILTDKGSAMAAVRQSSARVGLETIERGFDGSVSLTHTELGVPGVLMKDAQIIDLTGLANPKIATARFDFNANAVHLGAF